MTFEPRYVFDTSTVVSALLFAESIPGQALFGALGRGIVLVSSATFTELCKVLARSKFDNYVTRAERDQFLAMLLCEATLVDVNETIRACRDPRDDQFLELAVAGHAAGLVSSDQDLLALNPFRGIPIQTPAQFLTSLIQGEDQISD